MEREELHEKPRRTAFVGRETELDWLTERALDGLGGRPRLCVVRGERGIGKSRLLEELGQRMLARGVRVWSAGGGSRTRTPYASIAGLFQELLAASPRREEMTRTWAAAAAQLRRMDSPGGLLFGGGHSPAQVALSRAFSEGLLERATGAGLLLLIDDFQRFDELSATVLADLAERAGEASRVQPVRLALVVALRDEEAPGAAARRLASEPIADAIELRGFDTRQVEDLLGELGLAAVPQLTDRLAQTTDGNPLYLEHLVAQLRRNELLESRGGRWVAREDPGPLGLPQVLRDVVSESLSAEARDLLGWLAVHERALAPAALAALAELPPPQVKALLDEAAGKGLVVLREDEVGFAHGLHRRAVLSDLAAADRRRRHRHIAEALEQRPAGGPSRTEALALHWHGAWPDAPADVVVERVVAAADLAMHARDWQSAAGSYEDALRIQTAAGGAPEVAGELHYRAGQAYFRSNVFGAALDHFQRAVAVFAALGDKTNELRARIELLRTRTGLGKFTMGAALDDVAEVEAALARAEPDGELRVYARTVLAETAALGGDVERAMTMVADAIREAEAGGFDRMASFAWICRGLIEMLALELEGSVASFQNGIRYARRTEDPWLEGMALQRIPMVMAWLGRLDETRGYLATSRELAEQTRDWVDYSLVLGTHTAIAVARGDWREAEHMARQAVLVARRGGYPWGGALAASALSGGRALRGDFEGAREAIRLLEEPGILVGEPTPEWLAVQALARMRLRALEGTTTEEDRATCRNLLGLLVARGPDPQTLAAFCGIIDVARATGDVELAAGAAAAVAPIVERGAVFTATCDELLHRALGAAAALAGETERARELFERAVEVAERAGTRVLLARAHLDLGELLEAMGEGAAAERNLTRARELFAALGLRPLQSLRDSTPVGMQTADLGEEHSAYLRGLAAGRSDDELAIDLLRTADGVQRLRDQAFERIGVDGATGAVAWAMQEGLVDPPRAGPAAGRPADLPHSVPPLGAASAAAPVIWVSDIAGSTALLDRLGDVEGQALIREHNAAVRDQLARHGGSEVQHTGDGFIATFAGAEAAVRCAVHVQRSLADREASPVAVRVGIHAGDILFEEGRIVGIAMNTTARICGACEGAEVLVSDRVLEGCEEVGAPSEDLGPTRLRGIHRPLRLHRIRWEAAL